MTTQSAFFACLALSLTAFGACAAEEAVEDCGEKCDSLQPDNYGQLEVVPLHLSTCKSADGETPTIVCGPFDPLLSLLPEGMYTGFRLEVKSAPAVTLGEEVLAGPKSDDPTVVFKLGPDDSFPVEIIARGYIRAGLNAVDPSASIELEGMPKLVQAEDLAGDGVDFYAPGVEMWEIYLRSASPDTQFVQIKYPFDSETLFVSSTNLVSTSEWARIALPVPEGLRSVEMFIDEDDREVTSTISGPGHYSITSDLEVVPAKFSFE